MIFSSEALDFTRVMKYPGELFVFDFSGGYDPDFIRTKKWGIGRYDEKRPGMYVAPQYDNRRNIHMGIDIWTEAGSPVFSFYRGTIAYLGDNSETGNYGPTLVVEYDLNTAPLFALYGHLSRPSLEIWSPGDAVGRGEQIATLGTAAVNGGWVPHLHFQLSLEDPGEADMPGVVADEDHERALRVYPDPRKVLGDLY